MMRALPCDGRGDHAGLRAGVRAGLVPEVVDRHREQRHRDALARGEQHVQLAAGRQRADLVGQVEQLVGGVAHRGDDHDDVVAGLAGGDDPLGDPLDPLGVGDRGTAVLLHDQRHGRSLLDARAAGAAPAAPAVRTPTLSLPVAAHAAGSVDPTIRRARWSTMAGCPCAAPPVCCSGALIAVGGADRCCGSTGCARHRPRPRRSDAEPPPPADRRPAGRRSPPRRKDRRYVATYTAARAADRRRPYGDRRRGGTDGTWRGRAIAGAARSAGWRDVAIVLDSGRRRCFQCAARPGRRHGRRTARPRARSRAGCVKVAALAGRRPTRGCEHVFTDWLDRSDRPGDRALGRPRRRCCRARRAPASRSSRPRPRSRRRSTRASTASPPDGMLTAATGRRSAPLHASPARSRAAPPPRRPCPARS